MISCCILLRGAASDGGGQPLVVATFARDFIDFDTRVVPDGVDGTESAVDIPPAGYSDDDTTTAPAPTGSRGTGIVEPDVLLQHETYARFRVGWSESGLLFFERLRISSGAATLEYVGGSTTLLPDEDDQVFEIPRGPVSLDIGPYRINLRPGPVDPLWPAPAEGQSTSRVHVRRSRLATQDDIDWWLSTTRGAAIALSPSGAALTQRSASSSRRMPGMDQWGAIATWDRRMLIGRTYQMKLTLDTGDRPPTVAGDPSRLIAGAKRPPRMLTIAPFIPGCVVTPRRQHVEPRGKVELTFWLNPLGEANQPDARLDVYCDARLVGRVPTPLNVVGTIPWRRVLGVGLAILLLAPLVSLSAAPSRTASMIAANLVVWSMLFGGLMAVAGGLMAMTRRPMGGRYAGPMIAVVNDPPSASTSTKPV
ncbi:MAG: hypothetical protein AB7K09_00590 [Planctomycetota bacterium]